MFETDLGLKETTVNRRDPILDFMELKNPLSKYWADSGY